MTYWIALLAAFGCAVCNGVASVLQKVSADKEARAVSLDVGLFVRLLKDWPYLLGTSLDGIAWVLTLVAVHSLPLFVVQPIIAFSVAFTALIEWLFFKRSLTWQSLLAITLIVAGLSLLASTSQPETAATVHSTVRWVVVLTPLLLAAGGIFGAKSKHAYGTALLAGLSGVGFGATSIVGRMLSFEKPYWQVIVNPLFISLLAYGLIAIVSFTVALQRQRATKIMAIMITLETLVPAFFGLLFLGDHPKPGLWPVLILGAVIALSGTIYVANSGKPEN